MSVGCENITQNSDGRADGGPQHRGNRYRDQGSRDRARTTSEKMTISEGETTMTNVDFGCKTLNG